MGLCEREEVGELAGESAELDAGGELGNRAVSVEGEEGGEGDGDGGVESGDVVVDDGGEGGEVGDGVVEGDAEEGCDVGAWGEETEESFGVEAAAEEVAGLFDAADDVGGEEGGVDGGGLGGVEGVQEGVEEAGREGVELGRGVVRECGVGCRWEWGGIGCEEREGYRYDAGWGLSAAIARKEVNTFFIVMVGEVVSVLTRPRYTRTEGKRLDKTDGSLPSVYPGASLYLSGPLLILHQPIFGSTLLDIQLED